MIRVRQVKVKNKEDIIEGITAKLQVVKNDIINFKINKMSLDARHKNDINYVYEVDVQVVNEEKILNRIKSNDILKTPEENYQFEIKGTNKINERPVIIGSGPAGLFSAYLLAENGYRPIIIERGEQVEDRVKTVNDFWETGNLNPESNVQFGEGGAGTFSDGKLNTLSKDKEHRAKKVFETFVSNGAPEEILYSNKPHIGTDLLRDIIKNMRNQIIKLGGEFHYNTCLKEVVIEKDTLKKIQINDKIINCEVLILAIGHSARDTFEMLYNQGIMITAKPFAIGVRIQHNQEMINKSQYGKNYIDYPPADYKLTYTTSEKRGIYSFCMCPGGYVVNASSENNLLAVNGMSNYLRDSENANSALVVTVSPEDFGNHPLSGIEFQREIEALAFQKGNGKIPIQLFKDFKENKNSTSFGKTNPVFKGQYQFANLNEILPEYICVSIKEGIKNFENKIKGYASDDAILAGVETRTSSPIRIQRDENYLSSIKGIYPCGEGAGYAGGITTSAIDGIKVAEAIAQQYKNI